MKKFLLTIGFLFALATVGNAQSQCVDVEEIDGSPRAPCIRELKVTNGTLSCPTVNRCVLTISGGGSGSPGGSPGQVQWNDTGSFNGTSGLTATATTVTIVSGVSATFSNTSPLISATNSANSASVQIAIWQGDRATVTANDEAYFTFRLSDDGGGQTEVARLTWAIPTATAAVENGRLDFSVMTAGTLAKELQLSGADLAPSTNDGLALGTSVNQFSDLFLASGAVIDFANGNAVITHSSGILTVSTGDLRVTTAGTNTASVVTVGGTQTLNSKTLASPTVTGNISAEATSRLIYGSNEYRYTNTTGPAFYDDTTGNILTFNVQSLAANRTVTFPNSSLTIAGIDVANAWADGVKQTFNPDATTAGFNVGSVAGDPSVPANGDCWYDSTANEFTCRINGANVALGAGGGGITVGTTTVTSGTATRLFYETAGNVVGQVSGATSDGTNVTFGSGNLLATSPAFTTSQTTTNNSIGTTSTDGIVLQNTTAAAAGAQQYSPRLRFTGQGWKTNATAASQTTDWIVENIPVQGTANPDAGLNFSSQINAGGYSTKVRMLATAGSGTSGAGNLNILNPNGTNAIVTGYGRSYFGSNVTSAGIASSPSIMLDASNTTISIRRSGHIGWSNSGSDAGTSQDASFIAASAGVIRCANGGTGACTGFVLGTSTVGSIGTSGVGVLAIANGTAPSSSPADEFQIYSADSAAGDANAFIRNEGGEINRISGLSARNSSSFAKTSDTTLANITGLTRNVEAGRTYYFETELSTTSANTGGVKFAISGTATATAIDYEGVLRDGTTISAATRATALDTTVCAVTAVTAATCRIRGVIVVNAAGTITVQFAQNASDGSASTVLVNQALSLRPIS